jgi:glycosyltransferase involved in cell wall biosynthesis
VELAEAVRGRHGPRGRRIRLPARRDRELVDSVALSVVVPCYNEEDVIALTHRELTTVLRSLVTSYEIIYVDDGSTDRTFQILHGIVAGDPCARVVSFARNFGHQFAVSAGLDHASGSAVVIIDADLQDPPQVIEPMLHAWIQGADVAYGVRTDREGESWFKRRTATAFYRLLGWVSDTRIPAETGDFRLIDRRVLDVFRSMPERDRFIRGMVSWIGFRQVPIEYRRAPRAAGRTKYPLRNMLRFAVTGILSFSSAPLHLAMWAGFGAAFIALGGMLYALVGKLIFNNTVPGWAAIFTGMMFVASVQLICIGIIGEYVGRVYMQSKARPLYVISAALGFPPAGRGQAGRPDRAEPAVSPLDLARRATVLRSTSSSREVAGGVSSQGDAAQARAGPT